MILPLLLTAAPALSGDHAALHPQDASVYLEVPDVVSLVAGYDQAPFLQMLRSEDVYKALEPFGVPRESLDLEAALQTGLGALLGNPEDVDLVQGIAAVSLSLMFDPENPSMETAGMQLVVDYRTPESAAKAGARLEEHLGSEESAGALELPMGGGMPGWSVVDQTRLLLGGGANSFESAHARYEGSAGGLSGDALMAQVGKELGKVSGHAWGDTSGLLVVRGFLRAPGSISKASGEVPASWARLFEAVTPLPGPTCFRMRLAGGRFVSESFSATDREATVLGVQPVDTSWLDLIPEGVMFAYAGSMNANTIGALVKGAMGDMGLSEEEAALARQSLATLEELGPNMVFYANPVSGIGLPKAYLWAELDQTEGFQEKLAATLETIGGPQLTISTRDYKVKNAATGERVPIPITTVKLPPEMTQGTPIAISPSFAVIDGKLLGAFSSVHVKRELKRLYSGDAEEAGTNPFKASGVTLPKDARSAFLVDWNTQIEGIFSLAKAFGSMAGAMAGEEGLPVDFSQLPPAQTFTQFFRPTIHYSQRVEGGLYRHHEASFGPETWCGLMALGYGAFTQLAASGMLPD